MGIESWALVGIFATLQAIFGQLDMGLSGTLTREMARLSVEPSKGQEMRNLVRTLEVIYWGIAVLVGITVVSLSPLIANHWVKAGQIPLKTIEQALLIMGFVMALQMPIGFYSGGLIGLQKQVLLNVINVSISTLRGVGAILILWLISPTIQAFFLWQIVVSAINLFLLMFFLWSSLPISQKRAVFQKQLLKGIWKFAVGMSANSILSVILIQMDKVVLSKMLSLEIFGYYILASTVAMSLGRFFTPIFISIYPRFTQLVHLDDQDSLKQLYHKSCQFMSVLILPAAIVVSLFSYEILFLWTQDIAIAEKSYLLLSILICGTAINGITQLPYALQLAFSWTSLSVYTNMISVILLIPVLIYMTTLYGAIGGASLWLIYNMICVFIAIPIMHRRILCKEKWRWYWQDVGIPLVAGLSLASFGRFLLNSPMSQLLTLQYLTIISVLTLFITVIATPLTRTWLFQQLLKLKLIS